MTTLYTRDMEILSLDWSDYIESHLALHEVTSEEVEQVVFDNPSLKRRGRAKGIYNVYGQTDAGRYMAVFVKMKDERTAFVLTARDMSDNERKQFRKKRKG